MKKRFINIPDCFQQNVNQKIILQKKAKLDTPTFYTRDTIPTKIIFLNNEKKKHFSTEKQQKRIQ